MSDLEGGLRKGKRGARRGRRKQIREGEEGEGGGRRGPRMPAIPFSSHSYTLSTSVYDPGDTQNKCC